MSINARQINLLRSNTSGTWTTLDSYLDRKRIIVMPWAEAQSVVLSAVQHIKIDSTIHLPSGLLAVLTKNEEDTLVTNAGICAAELVGAIGTAATTNYKDAVGNILNIVSLRDSITHDKITTNVAGVDYTVFGLIQTANSIAQGTAIAASGGENTQISFVYIAADGVLTLATLTATVDFNVNKVYIESQQPDVMMVGGRNEEMIVEDKAITALVSRHTVTTAFTSGEVITISTGAGGGSGASTAVVTPTSSTINLPATEALFNNSNLYVIRFNGVQLIRDVEVEWESTTTFSINFVLDVGDVFEIEVPAL